MKKFFVPLCLYCLCVSQMFAGLPQTIEALKKSLNPILKQQYNAKEYTWEFSLFTDVYKKNAALYKKSSYITSKELFIPLFQSFIDQKMRVAKDIISIQSAKDQKFIVIGSLYGGAQCLFDYIEHLSGAGIIAKDLSLNKNYSMIFLGNAISKSPYSQETLAIIGLLLYKNQDRVIYIQGNQEYQQEWLDHALGDQIAETQKIDTVPLYENVITKFFATCPLAAIITFDNSVEQILCTSSNQKALKYATENTAVVISGTDEFVIRENNTGLFMLPPIRGATNWKVVSACTPFMKEYYNFSTYSYVILDQKTITHIYRSENKKSYQKDTYNLYTGLPK